MKKSTAKNYACHPKFYACIDIDILQGVHKSETQQMKKRTLAAL